MYVHKPLIWIISFICQSRENIKLNLFNSHISSKSLGSLVVSLLKLLVDVLDRCCDLFHLCFGSELLGLSNLGFKACCCGSKFAGMICFSRVLVSCRDADDKRGKGCAIEARLHNFCDGRFLPRDIFRERLTTRDNLRSANVLKHTSECGDRGVDISALKALNRHRI